MRKIVYLLAFYFFLTGIYLLVAPMYFYTNTPGVSLMGPFNLHFIRDVGFVCLASAGGMYWGARNGVNSTAVVGASWPFLHALFHIQIWAGTRGFAMDYITLADFFAVVIPGFLALYASCKIEAQRK